MGNGEETENTLLEAPHVWDHAENSRSNIQIQAREL